MPIHPFDPSELLIIQLMADIDLHLEASFNHHHLKLLCAGLPTQFGRKTQLI